MLKAHRVEPPSDLPCLGDETAIVQAHLVDRVLAEIAVSRQTFARVVGDAARNGADIGDELVAQGVVRIDALGKAMAQAMELPFALPRANEGVVWRSEGGDPRILRTCTPDLRTCVYLAPRLETMGPTSRWLARHGASGITVTSLDAVRAHEAAASAPARLHAARHGLATDRPDLSARDVLTARQAYALGIATCLLLLATFALGWTLVTFVHAAISLLFLSITALRLCVLLSHRRESRASAADRRRFENELRLPVGPLPVYTVLVALHHEEQMVRPLVEALLRLNWPRSRLDIKLVCEADDPATLAAVRQAIAGHPGFELCLVEPALPRTKPKALNHALPAARGDYVVLYDAEDRPDPDQLLEAWLAFERGGANLACVQAPLVIRNGGANWLTAMFALEYAVLFRAVLPFLARHRLPIPLGGTSNHFRRTALDEVGAWDSHNVAEDADLGIRLARHGYRIDVICAPTSEIAPVRWRDWRNQRARWVKGWIQTYLVHMRHPVAALRQLGFARMVAFQMLFLSMVAGAVMHTAFVVYLAAVGLDLAIYGKASFRMDWLMAVDAINILSAALVFAALVVAVSTPQERPLMRYAASLWFYWILVSLASFRSVRQIFADPHGWEKTPHREAPDR